MKKSAILAMFIIFIFGVVFVGAYGMRMRGYKTIVLAERLEIFTSSEDVSMRGKEGENKSIIITNARDREFRFDIEHRIYPLDTTETRVNITTARPEHQQYIIDNQLVFTATAITTITITVQTVDGSRVSQQLRVYIFPGELPPGFNPQ